METNENVYSNEDITVTYQPRCCTNAELCAKQLSSVFRNSVIPWIDLNGAETEDIINQIKKCPSGALKYHLKKKEVA
ncbi:(4Fe-4S)-binding protein [Winogradskyella sp. SYSU M77433]|uniref:(4Fe-4S)-binding protein n=1 Tax=Winogradskyella sp. SYSU M77433 TaxID=3042722 RepID=UPI002480D280|nr:(4Fe-4S)-binding protein [Winogradskyella sp. SYSU M77433]MDH7913134.1 (4Fe-4S)-binding protein [Winogradskyella sp. SYSU M77433]|tara:strand:- start:377 stop:607 length:231 start_codon:yes stop_codon:yes gene_type:complete